MNHQITIEEYMEMLEQNRMEELPTKVTVTIEGFTAVVEVVSDLMEYIHPEAMTVDRTVSWGWVATIEDRAESDLKLAKKVDYPIHVRKDMYKSYIRKMCSIEFARHIAKK